MKKRNYLSDVEDRSGNAFSVIADFEGNEEQLMDIEVEEVLPILPLRNMVLFPGVFMPVSVGRKSSLKLVREAEKKNSYIRNRVKIGNNSSADIFVSIHLNKIPENQYYGWQTFFKDGNEDGKRLATCIQNNLNETMQKENKRTPLKINNVYIIKHVEIPTVIVECGFLSNSEEEKQLQQEEYQTKLAWGIYNGIMEYF